MIIAGLATVVARTPFGALLDWSHRKRGLIVIASATVATGALVTRYNIAQGGASAVWGLGAALSNAVAGFMVDIVGYNIAFLFLATVALTAFVLFCIAVSETGRRNKSIESKCDAPNDQQISRLIMTGLGTPAE
jgi:MFS family permease